MKDQYKQWLENHKVERDMGADFCYVWKCNEIINLKQFAYWLGPYDSYHYCGIITNQRKRIAVCTKNPDAFNLFKQFATVINWDENKNTEIDIQGFELSTDSKYVYCIFKKEGKIIGIISNVFQNIKQWERVQRVLSNEKIASISVEEYKDDFLFVFKAEDNTPIKYISPNSEIADISGDSAEANAIWRKLNNKEQPSKDDFIRISALFNRSEDEIEEIRSRYLDVNRNKLGGEDDLYYYIKNSIPTDGSGQAVYGAFTKNRGQAIVCTIDTDGKTKECIEKEYDESKLFDLFSKHDEIRFRQSPYRFTIKIEEDGESCIISPVDGEDDIKIAKVLEKSFGDSNDFLKKYISKLTSSEYQDIKDSFYLYVSFEDIPLWPNSFNSYIFTLSSQKELCDLQKTGFYRYLMFIKHLENERTNEEKHKKAIASAIAAIMSRNMSHNLGSHFLYYSQQGFANLSGSLHDMFYEKDEPKEKVFVENNSLESLLHQTEKSYEYTKGASKVFEFLQDRMFYLAAITGIEKSQSLPVLLKSQVLDFITDETDYRNFYLNNLVRSEQYTLEAGTSIKLDDNGKDFDDLSISLPLGSISIHAIYNIFENFIRNSAKHQWAGRPKPGKLEFTIKVIQNKKDDSDITLQIFDNKTSANRPNDKGVTLIDFMSAKLQDIQFLDADDSLNNEDKGLKEMLLSAFWINNRQKDKSIGEIVYNFEKSGNKEAFLKNYGLVFVADSNEKEGNLGVEFHVNKHYYVLRQDEIKDKPYLTSDIVIVSDAESKEYEYGREVSKAEAEAEDVDPDMRNVLEKYVAAPMDIKQNEDCKNTILLLKSINGRLGFIDKAVLDINNKSEDRMYEDDYGAITFSDHMSSSADKLGNAKDVKERYDKYVYYDSISGGNYTKQLVKLGQQLRRFDESCLKKYETWKSRYYSLVIKESAFTRIAIIDERFFNTISYLSIDQYKEGQPIKGTSIELDFKNIQVLNLLSELQKQSVDDARFTKRTKGRYKFVGNDFRDANTSNIPNFLSIHFGIIQKLLERDGLNMSRESVNTVIRNIIQEIYGNIYCYNCNSIRDCDNINVRDIIKECDNIRVTIHSGRGTLSKQEREALSEYNVIPLGALRSAFLDSKYILCQLFYNLRYKKIKR